MIRLLPAGPYAIAPALQGRGAAYIRRIPYAELAKRLKKHGLTETEASITNKLTDALYSDTQPRATVYIANVGRQPAIVDELKVGFFLGDPTADYGITPESVGDWVDHTKAAVYSEHFDTLNIASCEGIPDFNVMVQNDTINSNCTIYRFYPKDGNSLLTNTQKLFFVGVAKYRSPISTTWESATTELYIPPRLNDEKDKGGFVPITDSRMTYDKQVQ